MGKFFVLVIFLLGAQTLNAQYYDDAPRIVLSFDGAMPLNAPSSEVHHPGAGGTAKISIPVGDYSDIVVSASLMTFLGKERQYQGKTVKSKSRNILPVMVGYRYYLSPLALYNTWYIEPRVGLTLDGTKHQAATYGASLGYLINNKVDLSAKYQAFGGQYNALSFIGLSFGYTIGLD